METLIVTKQQLLEMFNEYQQKHNKSKDKVSIKVKKFDVLSYANDQEHVALVELQPDQEIPKPKVVQVTDQQFAELANFYLDKAEQFKTDQNLSPDTLLQSPLL
jgi:hypothetical protein